MNLINVNDDNDNNDINLFEMFNIDSPQNHRILIIGGSGSRKTTCLYRDLIFNYLPKHFRHIYISGIDDIMKKSIIPHLENKGIQVFEKILDQAPKDDIINLKSLGKGDLVIIDDLSDIMSKNRNGINNFLNKAFTTSRHQGYNIILIVHKLKLNNPMIRNNATKIILTSSDTSDGVNDVYFTKEIEEEFGGFIINRKVNPVVLNPLQNFQQEKLTNDNLGPRGNKNLTMDQLLKRIEVKRTLQMPKFTRHNTPIKFVKVNVNDEEFNYRMPKTFEKLLSKMHNNFAEKKMTLMVKHPFEFDKVTEEASKLRDVVNAGEFNAGNDNVNKPIIKPMMKAPIRRRN
jgi:hypothetical protein